MGKKRAQVDLPSKPRPTRADAWLARMHQPDLRDPTRPRRPPTPQTLPRIQTSIPCVLMRGGTSKGLFFLARHLPADAEIRNQVLLAAMGSPDRRQIDGLGGGDSLTSKVAIVAPSADPEWDVDYLFAQVSVDRPIVDTSPTCGNILAGVATFAVEEGLVLARNGQTRVRIRAVNNRSDVVAVVQTPGKHVTYEGEHHIDGVPGTAAPVVLNFRNIVGNRTGAMLPTFKARDTIAGVEVTCIDVAMPLVLLRAEQVGCRGDESPAQLNQNIELLEKLENIRRWAGLLMGLGDVSRQVIPKVAMLSRPRHGGTITSRYFVPEKCHATHAVTGAICVAAACMLPGSVAENLVQPPASVLNQLEIEHPAGKLTVQLTHRRQEMSLEIIEAGVVSTARRLFEGRILIPGTIRWR